MLVLPTNPKNYLFMKPLFKITPIVIVTLGLVFASCRRDRMKSDSTEPDETAAFSQHSSDVNSTNNNADISMNDAETALTESSLSGFRMASNTSICNATIDTTQLASLKKIVITYNGNSCDGLRNRTGVITLQLIAGTKWKDAGAVLSITYTNFKVTVLSSGKSTTLNGTHIVTNVSGGIVAHIGLAPNPTTIVRKIRATNMSVTFDDGTVRSWSAARKRTWTGAAGVATSLTVEGDTILGGVANTEVWGTNRAGKAFTTSMTTPLVVNSSCGWFSPVSGKKTHDINGRVSTITFGTDANGNVVNTGCPNHYIINWTSHNGTPKQYIGSY